MFAVQPVYNIIVSTFSTQVQVLLGVLRMRYADLYNILCVSVYV